MIIIFKIIDQFIFIYVGNQTYLVTYFWKYYDTIIYLIIFPH